MSSKIMQVKTTQVENDFATLLWFSQRKCLEESYNFCRQLKHNFNNQESAWFAIWN